MMPDCTCDVTGICDACNERRSPVTLPKGWFMRDVEKAAERAERWAAQPTGPIEEEQS